MSKFSVEIQRKFEVMVSRHADTIMQRDFPAEWKDIVNLLSSFELRRSWLVTPGGSKSAIARHIDDVMGKRGWIEKQFDTGIQTDGEVRPNPTHKIDCYKNRVALELEWNNKTEFYDRDLNNFRILNDLNCISVGVIITRATSLDCIFKSLGIYSKVGASTTHMNKLVPRIDGGGAGGCPVIALGIKPECYKDDA